MAKTDEGGGGAVGKLWRKHGGGYYALLAVGTFMYLEFTNLISSIGAASGIRDFLVTELFTFVIESIVNTLLAPLWPFMWFRWMGTEGPVLGRWGLFVLGHPHRRCPQSTRGAHAEGAGPLEGPICCPSDSPNP